MEGGTRRERGGDRGGERKEGREREEGTGKGERKGRGGSEEGGRERERHRGRRKEGMGEEAEVALSLFPFRLLFRLVSMEIGTGCEARGGGRRGLCFAK